MPKKLLRELPTKVNKARGAMIHWKSIIEESTLKIWSYYIGENMVINRNLIYIVEQIEAMGLIIMSSATSVVTYTSVYTDSKPGRAFWGADDEEVSEGGIPRVIVLGYDRLPIQPVAPPSPDYVPGPKDPQTPPPIYPEYIPLEDEHEFQLAEKSPILHVDSPTLTLADSTIAAPVDEPVFPHEGTEPIIPPPSTDITIGARITVRPQASISLPSPTPRQRPRCTAPPAHSSPLLPSSGCPTQIQTLWIASTQALIDAVTAALPSPPLPSLPPSLYIPPPVDRRDDIPELEQPPRKRLCLSTLGSRFEIGESSTARSTRGRGIDYGFVSTVDVEERRQGIRDVGYGIRDTWVDPAEAVPEIAPITMGEVNTRVTELAELHEHDTQDLYALLEDAQDSRSRISQRVDMNSQRVDILLGDRMTLQETVWMVEEEAYASPEAWAHSIGLSQATHQELQTHHDHVYAHETHLQAHQIQLQLQGTLIQTQHQVHETRFQMQQAELAALRETDRRRQVLIPRLDRFFT
ncbi:hypothetical protein Tco_0753798 [Tanacetum coccineum]